MPTSWPTTDPVTSTTLSRTHYDGGGANAQAVTEGRIGALVDRDEVLIQRPFSVYFGAATTTESSYTTVWSGEFVLTPSIAGKTLSLTLYAYNSSAGTMRWQAVVGSASAALGADVSSTSSTNESTLTLTLPAMTTLLDQEIVDFTIQAKRITGSGNATVAGPNHSLCYVSD